MKTDSLIIKSEYNIFLAYNFFHKFCGYMLRKKPHFDAIIFLNCNSIHTFFMRFNIDVLFLDDEMKVIKKIEGLKPGKMIFPLKECTYVIEGKEGIFKDIYLGDIIEKI
jgi:uncharacterized membrane protein (UPF0127 family)